MRIFTDDCVASGKAWRVALAAVVLVGSEGTVAAKDYRPAGASRFDKGVYEHRSVGVVAPQMVRATFNPSGTVGRFDLGEDPYHPEGPGNVCE